MSRFFKKGDVLKTSLTVLGSLLLTVGVVGAATTISTNIVTEGTLAVTGASTLTGKTTMGYASSTALTASGYLYSATASSTGKYYLDSVDLTSALDAVTSDSALTVGATRAGAMTIGRTGQTVTLPGAVEVTQTLGVTGVTTLTYSSTTAATVSGAFYAGTASTTGAVAVHTLKVSATGSTIAGLVFGTCTLTASETVTASTTSYVTCTDATAIPSSGYGVIVQPTGQASGGLRGDVFVKEASSTAASTISFGLYNAGTLDGDYTTLGTEVISFMGVK